MAVTKVIKIEVDASQAKSELKNIESGVNDTSSNVSGLTGTLDKMTGGAVTKLKGFTSALGGVSLGFKGIGTAIAASGIGLLILVIAGITAAFKGSEAGQNKFAKLMGVIGAVTGNVVDVLADLGDFIINLFSGNGDAMKQLKSFGESIFNVIGLPIKNAIDIVKALGETLGALFNGDISGAFDALNKGVQDVKGNFNEAKETIMGVGDAIKDFAQQNIDEAKAAAKVADQRAKADTIERNLIVQKAEAEREIAELRLKAKDLNNVSAKERETALLKVLAIQDELITQETEILELRRDAQIAENTFARSNKENLLAEENAKAAVIAAETRRTDQKRQIQRELTAAENEQNSIRKQRFKEEQDRQKALEKAEEDRLKKIQELNDKFVKQNEDLDAKTLEEKLELERSRAESDLENLVGTESEKREAKIQIDEFYNQREDELAEQRRLEQEQKDAEAEKKQEADRKKASDKEIADAKAVNDAKEGIRNANLSNISRGFSLIASLDEKNKTLQATSLIAEHGVAIAKSIISTKAANALVTLKYAAIPGGIALATAEKTANNISAGLGIAASGIALAKGLAALKKGGGGGGGDSVGGDSGGSAPSAPAFNLVAGTGTNQIAESIGGQNRPIEAYVVSGNVTSGQSLDRNIVESSTI